MEVLGLEHVDLSVSDVARSERFYASVLEALGFKRFSHPRQIVSWSNGRMSITIRAATEIGAPFDRYRVGLHHLAFKAKDRSDVDELHHFLVANGHPVLDPPAEYPEYGQDYNAVFFSDPDGIKLELVHFPWGYWKRVQQDGRDPRPRYASRSTSGTSSGK